MKAARTSVLVGLPVVFALTAWFIRSPDDGATEPAPHDAPEPAVATRATTAKLTALPPVPQRAAAESEAAAPEADPKRGDARAMMAAAEADRIAAREARYAELDWDAPRPGPPAAKEPVVGKREAALSARDKLDQTEQMIELLRTRIAHTRARARGSDARLLDRLEKRVGALNETAQVLRNEQDAPGTTDPSNGDTGLVPGEAGADPRG
jgi:hypothetical protein